LSVQDFVILLQMLQAERPEYWIGMFFVTGLVFGIGSAIAVGFLWSRQRKLFLRKAEEANVIFKVMQKFRFHGSLMAAISYIHNPVYLEIRKDTTDHKLSIFDSLFHSIQPAVVINQTNMMKLQAVSTPLHTVSPDMINARIEFDNGCVANVTSSKYADSERFICKIHQANQQIQIDFHNQKVVLAEIGNDNLDPQPDTIETLFTNPLQDEIADFIQNILNHSHLNHFENGYATYLISRKIIEKISCESLSA